MELASHFVFIVFTLGVAHGRDCMQGGHRLGSLCYYFNLNRTTWSDANQLCNRNNRTLALPATEQQDDFLMSLQKAEITCGTIWLGVSYEDGQYRSSVDGDVVTFTRWASGEPSSRGNTRSTSGHTIGVADLSSMFTVYVQENCTEQTCHGWNDLDCSKQRSFYCQEEIRKDKPKLPLSEDALTTKESISSTPTQRPMFAPSEDQNLVTQPETQSQSTTPKESSTTSKESFTSTTPVISNPTKKIPGKRNPDPDVESCRRSAAAWASSFLFNAFIPITLYSTYMYF